MLARQVRLVCIRSSNRLVNASGIITLRHLTTLFARCHTYDKLEQIRASQRSHNEDEGDNREKQMMHYA